MTHSLYRSKNRWEKAIPELKEISQLQREINKLQCYCKKYNNKIALQKLWINQAEEFIEDLKKQGRVDTDELRKYFKRKKDQKLI